jgi:hypothetical protein
MVTTATLFLSLPPFFAIQRRLLFVSPLEKAAEIQRF